MWPNPQETADLVAFTEEIFNEKYHFCAVLYLKKKKSGFYAKKNFFEEATYIWK